MPGEGEGCAYRGRCLLALRTAVGEYPNVASEPLDFEEGLKIDVSGGCWGEGDGEGKHRCFGMLEICYYSAFLLNAWRANSRRPASESRNISPAEVLKHRADPDYVYLVASPLQWLPVTSTRARTYETDIRIPTSIRTFSSHRPVLFLVICL